MSIREETSDNIRTTLRLTALKCTLALTRALKTCLWISQKARDMAPPIESSLLAACDLRFRAAVQACKLGCASNGETNLRVASPRKQARPTINKPTLLTNSNILKRKRVSSFKTVMTTTLRKEIKFTWIMSSPSSRIINQTTKILSFWTSQDTRRDKPLKTTWF